MKPDPFLSYFGHPVLPCGYNDDPIDGFEVDSPGNNWAIWPALYDTFIGFGVLVITEDMLRVFIDACPDFAPDYENPVYTLSHDDQVHEISSRGWPEYEIAAINNIVQIPREARTRAIPAEWGEGVTVFAGDDELAVPVGARSKQIRKRA